MVPLHVIAVGARTPLGLTADASAAAVRAGVNRVSEHPFFIDRITDPVRLGQDSQLSPTLPGVERIFELVSSALAEVSQKLAEYGRAPQNFPLMLALPEFRPGWTAADAQTVVERLQQQSLPVAFSSIELFPLGHAAGLVALESASRRIAAGEAELFVVAGADSYLDSATLEWLDTNRQLATSYHRGAFFPGEAAGAFAIANENAHRRYGFTSLAVLRGLATAVEDKRIKSDHVCLGEGLTECVGKAVRDLRVTNQMIDGIVCDINGERYRSEEWGFTLLRLGQAMVDPTDYELPAASWGDVGAASGPLFVTMAVATGRRGYSKGARYLIWNSSENGRRAAAVLELNRRSEGLKL